MDRKYIKTKLIKIFFVLSLLLQQCWGQQNFNEYDDYDDQGNFNDQHPLDTRLNYDASQPRLQSHNNYDLYERKINNQDAQHYGEESIHRTPQTNYEEQQYSAEPQHPRVYQPRPEQHPPPPQDPNIILVPRLGLVRGQSNYKTIKNRPISAYLGLKYGTVKPGLGRFQKALSPELIENLIDATKEPSNCPQFPDLDIIREKESRFENVDDCLTLNVFTPAKPGSYPVLIFVHGEMLFDGSAEEGQPDYFLENDVVLVTINYRLAPFGYLSTLTDDMPGNVALSDIQMALEWVHEYIRSFNGNPEQVTLMGQSGGATLIHALSLSGKAEGLFHKLILQSGTALNPYFIDDQPLGTLRSFAHYARCPPSRNIEGLISCFERMSTSDLLNYFKRYFENNEPRGLQFVNGFKLIVGDKLGFLPEHPASMVANNTKPMIVGVTKDAGAFIMSRFYDQLLQLRSRNISDYINVVLKHTTKPRHYMLWKQWALEHIFTAEDARNPSVSNLVQKLLELINLILYRGPIIDSIRFTSKNHSTYMYCFDYRGEYHRFGHLKNPLPFEIDATLSDDNIFLFPYPVEVSQLNPEDKSMARAMVTMWVNFAIHGVPNLNTGIWPNVSSEYGPFLRFTNTHESKLELDHHFGEGIPVPNLYPEYFNTTKANTTMEKTTTTSTTTTTTTNRPYSNYQQTSYQSSYPNYRPYPNYNTQYRSSYPNYRSHEMASTEHQDKTAQPIPSQYNYPMNSHYGNYRDMRH
ncbi:glutactin [Lucilia cuprina]|uniref:glutactin n=1 Tax=Lucilia cuprina TaxID=7375 RepID=UPI001F05350C|nr:glutactin [Lucilia cuprina]